MTANNRKKAEMYILFIRAKGGFLFHRYGNRLPAKEQKKTETGGRGHRMFQTAQSDSGQKYQLPGTILSLQPSPCKRLGMTKNPFINNHIKIYDYDK